MKGAVYQGVRLMPGSQAWEMHEAKDWGALKAHLAMLHEMGRIRGEFL
jgi:hypothetical protein